MIKNVLILLSILFVSVPSVTRAQENVPEIPAILEAGYFGSVKFEDLNSLKLFYQEQDYKPVWLTSSFLSSSKATDILPVLQDSWKHGLSPAKYNLNEIKSRMEVATPSDSEKLELDILISDALVRYGRDLSGMRVNAASIGLRTKDWRQPPSGLDILEHVSRAQDAKSALTVLAPKGKLYKALQEELEALYKASKVEEAPSKISVQGILRPNTSNRAVSDIRSRMGFTADQAPQGVDFYDDELAAAVMVFQKSHGLEPDGIIGAHTIKIMNITREDQINQILVNLERLRWMEPVKPDRYVIVNVPSATLWAIDQEKVALEMPVIVGREKRPTNIFVTEITGIRFNPHWTVPPTIKRDDYLPKLREDPYYLTERGIELVDANNMTVDPGLINWQEKTWGEVNAMRMVQGAGSRNALGLVRVIMENPYNIYLHDTPTKSYFKRTDRALSSGCVRMAEPQKFADFVLAPNEGWTEKSKEPILASGKQTQITASQPLPVYIVYQTVWLGERGQIVYGNDIYNQDSKLLRELGKMNKIPTIADYTQAEPQNNMKNL